MAIEQNFKSFEDLLANSDLPLLVFFFSVRDGVSHLLEPVLEKVSTQMQQQLRIIKIDSEKYSDLASQYQVHALPTLLLFKNGQLVERIEEEHTENLMSVERLMQRLQNQV